MQPDADLEAARIKAIQDNAERLGLTWRLRVAKVSPTPAATPNAAAVTIDGDSESIPAVSMIGPLFGDQRVYVITSPPAGNHIVGLVDAELPPYIMDANQTGTGLAATSAGGVEAAIASANYAVEPTFVFPPGYVFELLLSGLLVSDNNTDIVNIRGRKGAQTTTGTLLASHQMITNGGTSGIAFNFISHFVNSGAEAVSTKLSMSIIRVAGTGAVYLFGPSPAGLTVRVIRMGPISRLPGLAAIAPSV